MMSTISITKVATDKTIAKIIAVNIHSHPSHKTTISILLFFISSFNRKKIKTPKGVKIFLASLNGFEPSTDHFGGDSSIQLRYRDIHIKHLDLKDASQTSALHKSIEELLYIHLNVSPHRPVP